MTQILMRSRAEVKAGGVKIIFAGTPAAAVPTLRALNQSDHQVVAVLTRPDAPHGRKRILTPSPVAQEATLSGIPLLYANRIDESIHQRIAEYGADLGVVVAYGAIIPQQTLNIPRLGWINLHFSELPLWRGAAPVQWQLISGATQASSSVFSLVKELDAGDVFDTQKHSIYPFETSGALLERLSELGSDQVMQVVDALASGTAHSRAQTGEVTYARKLVLEDGHLDPNGTATSAYNLFRGVTPEPGAYVVVDDERLKLISVSMSDLHAPVGKILLTEKKAILGCADGALELITVQPAGKQAMSAADWFRGLRLEEVIVS